MKNIYDKCLKGLNTIMGGPWYGIIALMIVFVFLPLTYPVSYAQYFLLGSIGVLGVLALYMLTRPVFRKDRGLNIIILAFGLYVAWMVFLILNGKPDRTTIVRFIQIAGCIVAFVCGATIGFTKRQMKIARWAVKLILLANGAVWVMQKMPLKQFSFLVRNTASYGTLLFCWVLFLLVDKKWTLTDWLAIALGLFLLFVSSARTSLLAALLTFFVILCFARRSPNKKASRVLLILILLGCAGACLAFILMYAAPGYTKLGLYLNTLSRKYFGKNFYSGRHTLWNYLVEAIKAKPRFGYGLNVIPSDIVNIPLSAHNTFLQVALQTGVTGLVLLMGVLGSISGRLIQKRHAWFSVAGVACIAGILVHECFESCLVQNMLVAGLQMWFVMGLCLNETMKENNKE